MHIKGLKKFLKNPTHSKFWKKTDFLGLNRQLDKARRHFGLSGSSLKRSMSFAGTGSNINSAGAVIPSHVGKSITEMY